MAVHEAVNVFQLPSSYVVISAASTAAVVVAISVTILITILIAVTVLIVGTVIAPICISILILPGNILIILSICILSICIFSICIVPSARIPIVIVSVRVRSIRVILPIRVGSIFVAVEALFLVHETARIFGHLLADFRVLLQILLQGWMVRDKFLVLYQRGVFAQLLCDFWVAVHETIHACQFTSGYVAVAPG
jgi:hypothetical protein